MREYQTRWSANIVAALQQEYPDTDPDQLTQALAVETPPSTDKGDIAFPIFPFARILRANPAQVASRISAVLTDRCSGAERVEASGPYVNVFLDRRRVARDLVNRILHAQDRWGDNDALAGRRVMIEFSCPNTNKPLHLGHLRNDALGESVSRIAAASGADVRKVNLINDRGIHICKSMLAYRKFGEDATPEETGRKSDHFVGDFYVRYATWEKEEPLAEQLAQEMLQRWEADEPETRNLWALMNRWAIDGIEQTYRRTGISFDTVYFESHTWAIGRERVLEGVDRGIFFRDEEGTVWADLSDIGLDRKVLLRKDGTTLYLTQDIGTAMQRHADWPFDALVYVVASEQRYHFQVLFEVLKRLGCTWAEQLHHLAYGMVNLPEGKMKSREGTVVDADDLLDSLAALARREIAAKGREVHVGDPEETAEKIALAALHYYLLQTGPVKDMIFNPEESLSFNGNTGPYLQYVGARISSMLRKQAAPREVPEPETVMEEEWELLHCLARYPQVVADAARGYNPSLVAGHLYETARVFSRFYHDHPIAVAADPQVREFRLGLSAAVMQVMRHGLRLLNIPFLSAM
jgi:arginyl-tRNA synthetase